MSDSHRRAVMEASLFSLFLLPSSRQKGKNSTESIGIPSLIQPTTKEFKFKFPAHIEFQCRDF
jgi:hypothetical protein